MGRGHKQTFLQRRHTNGQQIYEKILNITNHQGNANQNHKEIPPHTSQNGYYQKVSKERVGEPVGKGELLRTVDGTANWHSCYEGSSEKLKIDLP